MMKKSIPVVQQQKASESHTEVNAPTPTTNYVADAVMQEVSGHERKVEVSTPTPAAIVNPVVVEIEPIAAETEEIEESPMDIPEDLQMLFESESVNELSDKLSQSPISDLTKAMGINEKIFTVQELFGGNMSLFTDTMANLNNLSNLEQARDYLVEHVAIEQNWSAEDKIKKAAKFVKLIKRRY